ncbi:MAG: DnaJ domain-containing protein [Labilithrix sp.]|nr:DnaJ domain-containing protein [Labilithrix sp.]
MKGMQGDGKDLRERGEKLLAADHFEALGVARAAGADEVRRAFIEAVKTWHPDRVPAGLDDLRPLYGKVFARLELARATLGDPARRAKYVDDLGKQKTAATAGDVSAAEAGVELKKAETFLKKNDLAQAEQHVRRAVKLAPENVDAQALLAWVQAKPDSAPARIRELVGDLDRAIAKNDRSARAYFYRAQLKKRIDAPGAIADFARAAELDPSNVDAAREVRLHKMRQEKATAPSPDKQRADEGGAVGFFKKLFKR